MSTTTINYPLAAAKWVRRAVSRDGVLAVTGALATEAAAELGRTDWRRVPQSAVFADMPLHNADVSHDSDAYDCYQQCGDYAAGRQRVYAGAALYRFTLPADAAAAGMTAVALRLTVSRWTAEGARVVAWRSADAAPTGTWAQMYAGTITGAERVTEVGKPAQHPASSHATEAVALSWDTPPESGAYLWVLLSLEEYGATRGFWVEGAAASALPSIAVTFAGTVAADEDPLGAETPAVPLRLIGATRYDFEAAARNLDDGTLRLDWAAKMLSGGEIGESTHPDGYGWDAFCLGPRASIRADRAAASGYVASMYCPSGLLEGRTLRIRMAGTTSADLRIAVHTGSSAPDPDAAATWRRGALGTAVVLTGAEDGDEIDIPLAGTVFGDRLYIAVSLSECPAETPDSAVGAALGVNVVDAHIGATRYVLTAIAPEWIGMDGERAGGLLLPMLTGAPEDDLQLLNALSKSGAVGAIEDGADTLLRLATAAEWLTAEPPTIHAADIWESSTGVKTLAAIDGLGTLRLGRIGGGTIRALLAAQEGAAATHALIGQTNDLADTSNMLALLHADGTVTSVRGAAWDAGDPSAWASIASIAAARDGGLLVGVTTAGTVVAAASTAYAGAATAIAAWTGIARIVITSTHAVGLQTNGTLEITAFAALSPYASMADALTWTDLVDAAAVPNGVVGIADDGSVLVSGSASWIDTEGLPAVQGAVGSWWRRLALRLA